MNEKSGYKFGVKAFRCFGDWSFGCCVSHGFGETYLCINFAIWTVCIGWLMKESETENE